MLPTVHPTEVLKISPEALEVANAYLQLQDIAQVSENLNIPAELVTDLLERSEVKSYIDRVFLDVGFNNRFKMRAAMDAILAKKFQEMDEADVGSNKDIIEIMALSHKMTMELMDREIALRKLDGTNIRNQVNVQINDQGGGSNYNHLLERLMGPANA
jgi:hypothetical protein